MWPSDGGMGDNLEYSLYGQRFTPLVVGRWDEPRSARRPGRAALRVGRHRHAGRRLQQPADRRPRRRAGHWCLLLHDGATTTTGRCGRRSSTAPTARPASASGGRRRRSCWHARWAWWPRPGRSAAGAAGASRSAAADAKRGQQHQGDGRGGERAVRDRPRAAGSCAPAGRRRHGAPAWRLARPPGRRQPGVSRGQSGRACRWRRARPGSRGTRRPTGSPWSTPSVAARKMATDCRPGQPVLVADQVADPGEQPAAGQQHVRRPARWRQPGGATDWKSLSYSISQMDSRYSPPPAVVIHATSAIRLMRSPAGVRQRRSRHRRAASTRTACLLHGSHRAAQFTS